MTTEQDRQSDCLERMLSAAKHPTIPWSQMNGMRNRMAHGYFELDLDIVWDTVRTAIPDLETNLRSISL